MVQSITATQKAAQEAASGKPYIPLIFTSTDGLVTYDYTFDQSSSTNRLMMYDVYSFPYSTYWTGTGSYIYLMNNDDTIPDLRGYYVDPGMGNYSVAGGNEAVTQPRLWVGAQSPPVVSGSGVRYVRLKMLSMWDVLYMIPFTGGSAPDYTYTYTGVSLYDVVEDLIETYTPFTLDALAADDGILDTITPDFIVNERGVQYQETIGQAVYRAVTATKEYLVPRPSLAFKFVYPQSTDSVDKDFESPLVPTTGKHGFYSYTDQHNLVIPNKINVYATLSADGTSWGNNGSASDTPSQLSFLGTSYPILQTIPFASTLSDAQAALVAAAYLARAKAEEYSGVGVTPHASEVEVYDYLTFTDKK